MIVYIGWEKQLQCSTSSFDLSIGASLVIPTTNYVYSLIQYPSDTVFLMKLDTANGALVGDVRKIDGSCPEINSNLYFNGNTLYAGVA